MEYGRIRDIYTLLEEREIPDLHSRGFRLRHRKTGARIMLLENDDKNKVFYVGFRTPPKTAAARPISLSIPFSAVPGSSRSRIPLSSLQRGVLILFLTP